ncbi:MAG: RimK family alpha-L-glutamate ligase [Acholeplasmatales bacterium]|jgi:RimK family alpha-L-glutamate ligase|nr:RimK family alpha-L-glutamate ligase [Acholeplasmatales bacterium]
MNKGIILYNCFSKTQFKTVIRYKNEFAKLGISVDLKRNNELKIGIDSKGDIFNNEFDYDFCLYYDQDEYIGRMLEKNNIRLFNPITSIINCADKMLTHIVLANNQIKMPKTIPGLHCYSENSQYTDKMIASIIKQLKLPIVFKLCYGGCGDNVFKVDTFEELKKITNANIQTKHLFQEYIKQSSGKDVRVIVIGHKVVGAMLRINDSDFRANLNQQGKGENYLLPKSAKKLAERVSVLLNLDYCGIDLLFNEKNDFMVCEVNSNAYITGFEKATKINVAEWYAKYIIEQVYDKNYLLTLQK